MDTAKLDKWAELLLDTGKRNNLINFKDSKSNSAEVIAPDFYTVFKKAEHAAVFEVFDPKLEKDDDTASGASKEMFMSYADRLKKNQILLYNFSGKPMQALKKIGKQARSAVEETGVNIAYIAFGFVHWTEGESRTEFRAPLLLAPVSIENQSAIEPFYIRLLEDDMIVNPTFAFKLQNDYGIKLPEYDEDAGIEAYLNTVSALFSKLKWRVVPACKIGIFSFLKINMYKDIKENAAKIIRNENVRVLLGEAAQKGTDAKKLTDLLDLNNVVDADSSQAEAIEAAKEGQSFVLQGPPGTGKSQTITNIIAECLSDGKKVLFVSEKLAALNVVYDKLKKAGLEEFCLELHSHKANKKQIIEELCRTLKLAKSGVSDKAERELKLKKEAQRQLDEYAEELHKLRPVINKTLYQLYEEVSACRAAPRFAYVIDKIEAKGEDDLEQAETCLNHYAEYTASVGTDYHANVWYGYAADASYQTVMQLKADLRSAVEFCHALHTLSTELERAYNIGPITLNDSEVMQSLMQLIGESEFLTPAVMNTAVEEVIASAEKLKTIAATILQNRGKLDADFDGDIYRQDGALLFKKLTKQFRGRFSRLFSKEYRRIASEFRLCRRDGKRMNYASMTAASELLKKYQQQLQTFSDGEGILRSRLGDGYAGADTDFGTLLKELYAVRDMIAKFPKISALSMLTQDAYRGQRANFQRYAERYRACFGGRQALGRILLKFDKGEYDICGAELGSLAQKFSLCIENIDKLDDWCNFVKLLQRAEALSLRGYIDQAIKEHLPADKMTLCYKKIFFTQWIDLILHQSPVLTELSRVPHDKMIARFKEKDTLNFDINRVKIKAKLSAQRPGLDMVAQGSAISVLLRENEKKRKKKGIRQLLHELGDLTLTLKPCFLMSPLSVSTYLDSDMKFDVVVFDEASQIFPQDAIGAIYRGKQLIVVGDSQQMPPSNFFHASGGDDDDDESEDVTDFESILDLCSAAFSQRRLKWHYRSRSEQLISFSNKNFYDNDLVTFPSPKADRAGTGVEFVFVNGVFDRKSKTNREEAERIADLVFENFKKYPARSLGVVAFSISQQNLIDKLIYKRRQQDPGFEEFFKTDRAEPFFVKNLETVQGDERDTIIFSIAYARDAQGRLLLNFGPVNREGGERRLNVAVTRAKLNVQLVSSIHAYDIDLSRTKSEGARLLREYLDFAENGAVALERDVKVSPSEQFDSEFELEVCEFLRENGYTVDPQVGCSSFRIDLALKRPNSSDYLLAIECDGASYHSSKTARDRDRLRQDILERMGWKFYRIWSTDWFRNASAEKERLLKAVEEAMDSAPPKSTLQTEFASTDSFEQAAEETHFQFPKYHMVDASSAARQYRNNIFSVVSAIVRAEAPISEEWLLKRIVFLFGREKVTNVVREEFDSEMRGCSRNGLIRRNGFFYLRGEKPPMLRVPDGSNEPRDIKYIDTAELALGLKEILKQNITVEKQGLFKLITQCLGFNRVGDAITERLEAALGLLSKEIELNGEVVTLKP